MPVLLQPSSFPAARAAHNLVHARANDPLPTPPAGPSGDPAADGGPAGNPALIDTSRFSLPVTGIVVTQTRTLDIGDRSSTTISSSPTSAAQSTVTVVQVVPPTSSVTDAQANTSASVTATEQTSDNTTSGTSTTAQQTSSLSTTSVATQASSTSTNTSSSSTTAQGTTAEGQATTSSAVVQVQTTPTPEATVSPANNNDDDATTLFTTITLANGQVTVSQAAQNAVDTNAARTSLTPVGGAASTNKVSPAVIAVPIILVFLIFVGVGVFILRRQAQAKRQRRRNTWGAGILSQPDQTINSFGATERNYEQARAAGVAPNAYGSAPPPPMMQFTPAPPMTGPPPMVNMAPPPQAYNSPSTLAPNMSSPYSAIGPGAAMGGFGAGAIVPTGAAARATVKCSFVPSMPDELPITAGEPIRMMAEYDDGWALCENARGEQGMVPLDCLERGNGGLSTPTTTASFSARSQRRASSLVGAGVRGPMD